MKRKRKLQINPEPLKRVSHRIGQVDPPSVSEEEKREVEEASRQRAKRRGAALSGETEK